MAENNFTTTDKLEDKIKKLASDHRMTLSAQDSIEAARRLTQAYNEILGALLSRGLSKTQIDAWGRGEEFQLDIAIFWYCKDSGWGGKQADEEDWTTVFDRRKELLDIPVVVSDVLVGSPAVALGMDLIRINEDLEIYP